MPDLVISDLRRVLLLVLRDSRSCYARNVSFIVDLARILRELVSKKFLC